MSYLGSADIVKLSAFQVHRHRPRSASGDDAEIAVQATQQVDRHFALERDLWLSENPE
jgi:hypothetical protein